jgi:hypothetical protein
MKDNEKNDDVEALLKIAGKRTVPNEQLKTEVYENVYKVWKQQNNIPFYRNRYILAAASLFILIGVYSINLLSSNNSIALNSQISKEIVLSGQIQRSLNQVNWSFLKTDSRLNSGDYIRTTSNNRILVELNNGNTFRLDENSFIKIISEDKIELIRGQIYVESNENNTDNNLIIDTSMGSVRHIGTQYNIELKPESINISVRKGIVLVHKSDLTKEIKKGYVVSINNNGNYQQSPINSYDSKWQWTQNITKYYNIQDKTIYQYLNWVSNETGYSIIWDSNKSEKQSKKITLSGSIKGMKPIESLEVILPTTDFKYNISHSAIHILD